MSHAHKGVAPAHQFESVEQQQRVARFGMWMFLISETMIFGALFTGYAVYWTLYPEAFQEAAQFLDVTYGTVMTVVLLVSSTTVALAITALEGDRRRLAAGLFGVTIALGLVFFVLKIIEYAEKIGDGLLPTRGFEYPGAESADQAQVFFSWYFVITGTHAVHLIVGLAAIGFVIWPILRGTYHAKYFSPVEGTGLYWHLVDVIWIFVFPLLYLMGRAGGMG